MFNFGGLGNMASLLSSAQQIPAKMQQLTEQLKKEHIHGSSADGTVKVTMNGVGQMQSIEVDPSARESSQLESSIVEATNKASDAAKQRYAEAVSKMATDMNIKIPGLDGLLANLASGGNLTGGA